MMLCIHAAVEVLACLAGQHFSLAWTHSVEQTRWVEHYSATPQGLKLAHVFLKGSGAGMEPAPHAKLESGWYHWPALQPITFPDIHLANSGATATSWQLCQIKQTGLQGTNGLCINMGQFSATQYGPLRLVLHNGTP